MSRTYTLPNGEVLDLDELERACIESGRIVDEQRKAQAEEKASKERELARRRKQSEVSRRKLRDHDGITGERPDTLIEPIDWEAA